MTLPAAETTVGPAPTRVFCRRSEVDGLPNTAWVGANSMWATPYGGGDATPEQRVALYRDHVRNTDSRRSALIRELLYQLRWRNLANDDPLDVPSHVDALLDLANGPMGAIEAHPLAQMIPRMDPEEFSEHKASIQTNGQRDDIVLLDGMILDGRHRYRACEELRIAARFRLFDAQTDGDAIQFAIDKNIRRRHLKTGQRAMIAADLETYKHGGDRRPEGRDAKLHLDRAAVATQLGVSVRTVATAADVRDHGAPELKDAVRQGQVSLSPAADIARGRSVESQRAILAEIAADPAGRKALKRVAKEVRAEEQKARHGQRQVRLEQIAARNPELPAGRLFSFVLIDVPRHHDAYADETGSEKAPENHFPTIPFKGLCDFPIDRFAAPDSIIAYWSTAASLIDDLDILAEWGFVALRARDAGGKLLRDADGEPLPPVGRGRYGSHQIWRKVRVGNATGMGRWFRDQHELLILARRGDVPAPIPGQQPQSVFDAPVGEHSEKPGEHVRAWIDRCWPHLSKIEAFARGDAPPGWVFWGNQVGVQLDNGLLAQTVAA